MRDIKGITLIALIVTIIVLLILAGITLSLITGENGILKQVTIAKEETIKAQLKEEIEFTITDIQMEEINNQRDLTLETIKNQLPTKLEDITAELENPGIVGEYKGYEYTIDDKFIVTIGGKADGIRPEAKIEILNTDYTFTGPVKIKVVASISEGNIREIKPPEGATLVNDISNTQKIYEVQKGGKYSFTIVADSGRKTGVTAEVTNLLEAPKISIQEITESSFKIQIENKYPEKAITEYKYYVDNKIIKENTTDNNYTLTGLNIDVEYKNIKVVAYINEQTKESNIMTAVTQGRWSPTYDKTMEYTDTDGKKAMIPAGFQVSETEGQNKIVDGLVIRDAQDKNEFVWIPVETGTYQRDRTYETLEYSKNAYTEELNYLPEGIQPKEITSEKNEEAERKQVKKYNGFYIGRYEAGKEEAEDGTMKAVSKKGKETYTELWYTAMNQKAKQVYNTEYAKTARCSGIQWDMAMEFVNGKKDGKGAIFNVREANSNRWKDKDLTGQNLSDMVCNIYDLEGNIVELVAEKTTNGIIVVRAAGYGAAERAFSYYGEPHINRGFRLVLYVM